MKPVDIIISRDKWAIDGTFAISRGNKTSADTVTVELTDGLVSGFGECLPYNHYGETQDSVVKQIESLRKDFHGGVTRHDLLHLLPAGSARNALDCAILDMECKLRGVTIGELLEQSLEPLTTAYTLSIDTPEAMAIKAKDISHKYHVLKMKCGVPGETTRDIERISAVRAAAPDAELIVDANEGWPETELEKLLDICLQNNVSMVEQPLPAGNDQLLAKINRLVPVCADESFRSFETPDSLVELAEKYDVVNIKLDKTGGLTTALEALPDLKAHNLKLMVGCMVSTSLSMAPAFVLAQHADFVDLDGPLLLAEDRQHPIVYAGSLIEPPSPKLWG